MPEKSVAIYLSTCPSLHIFFSDDAEIEAIIVEVLEKICPKGKFSGGKANVPWPGSPEIKISYGKGKFLLETDNEGIYVEEDDPLFEPWIKNVFRNYIRKKYGKGK